MTSQAHFTASHTRNSNKNQPLRYFKAVYPPTKVKKVSLELNSSICSQKVNTLDTTSGCDLEPWCEVHDDVQNLMSSWNVNAVAKMFKVYNSFVNGEASNQWKEIKWSANEQSIAELNVAFKNLWRHSQVQTSAKQPVQFWTTQIKLRKRFILMLERMLIVYKHLSNIPICYQATQLF